MEADISIVIALVIVFVLTMSILFFVSTNNVILESTFYGYRNPIWLRIDRDLRQLAFNSLREASNEENESIAYTMVGNWADKFNSYVEGMIASVNNVSIILSNETEVDGSSYAFLEVNVTVCDLGINTVTYDIRVNVSVYNFTLITNDVDEYNYSLTAVIMINQYIYYDIIEEDEIHVIDPEGVEVKNISYLGYGKHIITTNGEVNRIMVYVGGVKIYARPKQ